MGAPSKKKKKNKKKKKKKKGGGSPPPPPPTTSETTTSSTSSSKPKIQLEPEPQEGEEMTQVTTMPNTRMKNMGVCTDEEVLRMLRANEKEDDDDDGEDGDGGEVYDFWLSTEADGTIIEGFRLQISKDASKNADFPGFRKGQIPPYAQNQMTMFAIQESITQTCEAAVSAYGLKSLKGSSGEVTVNEDVKDMCAVYTKGSSIEFTATFRARFDKVGQSEDEGEGGANEGDGDDDDADDEGEETDDEGE